MSTMPMPMPSGYAIESEETVSGPDGEFLTVPCSCIHEEEANHEYAYTEDGCTLEDCYCEHGIPLSLDTYW